MITVTVNSTPVATWTFPAPIEDVATALPEAFQIFDADLSGWQQGASLNWINDRQVEVTYPNSLNNATYWRLTQYVPTGGGVENA